MNDDQIDTEVDVEHAAFMRWFLNSRDLVGQVTVKTAHCMELAWRARAAFKEPEEK